MRQTGLQIRQEVAAVPALAASRTRPARALRAIRLFVVKKPLGSAGAVVLLAMIVAALGADWVAPYDPIRPTKEGSCLAPVSIT